MEWSPTGWDGLPLFCPSSCQQEAFHALCCQCRSLSVFDFDKTPCRLRVSAGGEITPNNCEANTVLEHTYQNLYKFPENICDFPEITKIILSGNLILDIPDLSCLTNLTYLDLSWNKITTLQNVSLVEKRNIRFVDGFPIDVSKEELRDVISIIDLIIPRAFCM